MSIQLIGDQIPSFPESFARRLQDFDKDLHVMWHKSPFSKKPGRWKIEMCIRHYGRGFENGRPLHDHTCQRSYVMMCQDEEGTPMPLGDWVLQKLREMRANSESLGGPTERGLKNFREKSDAIDQQLEQKREADRADMIQHNRKDKRAQLNKLVDLVQRHDMRPNR